MCEGRAYPINLPNPCSSLADGSKPLNMGEAMRSMIQGYTAVRQRYGILDSSKAMYSYKSESDRRKPKAWPSETSEMTSMVRKLALRAKSNTLFLEIYPLSRRLIKSSMLRSTRGSR
jgi:hypothetical protein